MKQAIWFLIFIQILLCYNIILLVASSSSNQDYQPNPIAKAWLGGTTESLLCCPFETVKAKVQQTQQSTTQCIRLVFKEAGVNGYWRGLTAFTTGNLGKTYVRWRTYDTIRSQFPNEQESYILKTIYNAASGACAGSAEAVVVVAPTERLRILATEHAAFDATTNKKLPMFNPMQAVCHEIDQAGFYHGLRYLFKGTIATVLKSSVSQTVRMGCQPLIVDIMTYDRTNIAMNSGKKQSNKPSLGQQAVAGGIAGGISAVVSQPMDTIKTVMQSNSMKEYANKRMMETACQMYRQYGVKCFWAGTTANLGSTVMAGAAQFASVAVLQSMIIQESDYSYNSYNLFQSDDQHYDEDNLPLY